jgi:dienelactone hydrolase
MPPYLLIPKLLFILAMISFPPTGSDKNPVTSIHEETVAYTAGGVTSKGYLAYDPGANGKRPAVIIVHEWWGLTDYPKMRARMLAEAGYVAFAADLFGNGKTAANPNQAMELTRPFYQDPSMARERLEAAIQTVKKYPQVDTTRIAAIGYCFGGSVVLNSALLGLEVKGVVSIHGGLKTPPVNKDLLHAAVLVCRGGSDRSVTDHDAEMLQRQLDSIHADQTFKVYPGATHAFSNPDATRLGKEFNMPITYNESADKQSWTDMMVFFDRILK